MYSPIWNPLLSLVMVAVLSVGVACYQLTMLPDEMEVSEESIVVTVTCKADVEIAACQFSWLDRDGNLGPVLDLSKGISLETTPYYKDKWLSGYKYSGHGLEAGDCGVALEVKGYLKWMVGCRVRTAQGGWRYAWMDLTSKGEKQLSTEVKLGEVVVLPHKEVRLLVTAPEPLGRCSFFLPSVAGGLYFDEGLQSQDSMGRHRYIGAGLPAGECGLKLSNTTDADNGPVRCYVENYERTAYTWRFIAVVLANQPSEPLLHAAYEGLTIRANCSVSGSRPEPTFTWLLGDKVLRQDAYDDSPGEPEDAWSWPWMKRSVLQSLTLDLTSKDEGKALWCVVSHVTLAQPLEVSTTIPHLDANNVNITLANSTAVIRTAHVDNNASYSIPKLNRSNIISRPESGSKKLLDEQVSSTVAMLLLNAVKSQAQADQSKAREAELSLLVAQSRAQAEQARAREAVTTWEAHRRAEEARAMEAELAVEAMRSHARAEEARARAEEDRALNAKEELMFERERRGDVQKQIDENVQ